MSSTKSARRHFSRRKNKTTQKESSIPIVRAAKNDSEDSVYQSRTQHVANGQGVSQLASLGMQHFFCLNDRFFCCSMKCYTCLRTQLTSFVYLATVKSPAKREKQRPGQNHQTRGNLFDQLTKTALNSTTFWDNNMSSSQSVLICQMRNISVHMAEVLRSFIFCMSGTNSDALCSASVFRRTRTGWLR